METSSKQEHAERPAEAGQAATTKDAFHVDTHLIPQATLDEQGSSELQELGLSVFNQDVFEQGIMEQVDQALEKEEETRLRNILMKEMKAINDDIIIAKKDLERVNKAEADAEAVSDKTRDVARQLESIRRQKENKVKQLRTLQVRRDNVKKKLARFEQRVKTADAEEGEEDAADAAFQVGGRAKKETERERMIRSGEMTPFGTVVRTASSKASTSKSHPVHLSEFEKTLMTADSRGEKIKKDFKKYMKKKTEDMKKPKPREDPAENSDSVTSERKTTARKTNRFDERDWRTYDKEPDYSRYPKRARHHFPQSLGDASGGSEEDDYYREAEEELMEDDDGDETWSGWRQSEEETTDDEFHDEVDEEEDGTGKGNLKRKLQGRRHGSHRKKPRPLPKYRENSDDEAPVRTKVKRDLSIRRERDDADPEWYQERLLRQQRADEKKEKMQQEASESDGDSSETEFDGGFRVPKQLWKKLFKYQKTGVRWLWELHTQQVGGIVGDEMGLGKTIQTISFLAALRTSKVRNVNFPYKGLGPTIIVCPTTVMHQWLKECHKWWPDFRVAILHSSGSFCGSESDLVRSIAKSFGILITSYNTLVIHQELVLRFNWHYVILDEGHKIRNPDAKVTLCCKQFRTPHRIILSGSPIQNNLKELWSLFDFVFPGKLGTLPDFMQHFAIPIVQGGYSNATQMQVETAYRCACVLRDTINPYLIRRMKVDVKKNLDLPSKNEQVLFCRLTDEQRDVYQEYLSSRECNAILQGKFQVFAGLITLRKICNHPDLSTGGPQIFRGEDVPDEPEYQFGHYKRSGKMIVVEALLRLWHKQEHRVLLFTQSKAMLNILEKLVQDEGYTYLTMDGGTSISARQPLISQFNNDRSIYLLLMTTRVGGLGVNLTGANRVIIYDPDWNPSTDIQARERAWRIGQKRQVTIYRLLTAGTIEEKIYHRQIFKQFLTNRVLKDPKQRRLFKSQDMLELFTLGSKDNQEGTETSALFAGTGSDVKIPKKLQKNRFDEIQDRKMKEREEEEMVDKVENRKKRRKSDDIEEREKVEEVGFDTEELERMKEFARQLSRKIEMEKKQREGETVKQTESLSEETSKESVKELASPGESGAEKDESVESLRKEDQNVEKEANVKPDIEDVKGTKSEKSSEVAPSVKTSSSSDVFSLRPSTSGSHNWKQNGKVWTIPTIKKDRKSSNAEDDGKDVQKKVKESRVHETEKEKRTSSSGKHKSSDRHHRHSETSHKKSGDEEDHSRHRKKKKRRDARFEGERIPHLVKHCPLSKSGSAETEDDGQQDKRQQQQDDQHHDDYVLRQLFKKTGIHGAMKHDKIMDCGRPDFAIVEAEAEKVAREAAAALRRSRQQCTSALSGVPTWTGHHGGVAKPRFGQKKNSLLVDKSSKGDKAAPSPGASTSQEQAPRKPSEKEKEKLFDGSISGNISLTAKNDSLSSNDLLSRIRARKRTSATAGREDDDDMFLQPDLHQTLDPKDEELLQDIRNYVAFMATTDGQATTQEIVLNFGKRLPKSDAPKFKAMLNQICDHQGGVWRLKAEFR